MALTKPGQKITSPTELKNYTEKDIARIGKDIYRRDLNKEQEALPQYLTKYGKPKSSEDWAKFHSFVYGDKIDQLLPADTTEQKINQNESLKAQIENYKKQLAELQKQQLELAQQQQTTAEQQIKDINQQQEQIIKQTAPEKLPFYGQAQKITGNLLEAGIAASGKIKENFLKNQQTIGELERLYNEQRAELEENRNRPQLLITQQRRAKNIYENTQGRIAVLEASLNMRNGQIGTAFNIIDKGFEKMNFDRQQKLAFLDNLYNFYEKKKATTEKDRENAIKQGQEIIKQQIKDLEAEIAERKKTAEYLKEQMINPETAEIFERAGVSLNDTIEEINKKLADYSYRQESTNLVNQMELKGYKYIANPVDVNKIPREELTILTDSKGRKYYFQLPPTANEKTTPWKIQETEKGLVWYNPKTTEVRPFTFTSGVGARTDRHNNPIAVSDAKKEWLDLLDKAGIKYGIGDPFPDNPSLHTLSFPDLQTGIEAAKVLLSNSDAFYWYKKHTGQILNDYGIDTPEEFSLLPEGMKEMIIDDIYQHEGGNQPTILSKKSKLKTLGSKQIEHINDYDTSIATMEDLIKQMETHKYKTGYGSFANWSNQIADWYAQHTKPADFLAFKAEVDRVFQQYRKLVTGAQASDKELARLKPNLPKTTDKPEVFLKKAKQVLNEYKRLKNLYMNSLEQYGYDTGAKQNAELNLPPEFIQTFDNLWQNSQSTLQNLINQ